MRKFQLHLFWLSNLLTLLTFSVPVRLMAETVPCTNPLVLAQLNSIYTMEEYLFDAEEMWDAYYLNYDELSEAAVCIDGNGRFIDARGTVLSFFGLDYQFIVDTDGAYYSNSPDFDVRIRIRGDDFRLYHSSFNRGQPVRMAGEHRIENGYLVFISNKSGHYRPGDLRAFYRFVRFLSFRADVSRAEVKFYARVPYIHLPWAITIPAEKFLRTVVEPSMSPAEWVRRLIANESDTLKRAELIVHLHMLGAELNGYELGILTQFAVSDELKFYSMMNDFWKTIQFDIGVRAGAAAFESRLDSLEKFIIRRGQTGSGYSGCSAKVANF